MRINYRNLASQREQLESLLHLAELAESCDTKIEDTFRLANSLRDSPQMQHCISRLKRDSRSRQLIDTKQPYKKPDPGWLETLDRGTLGHLYYQILKREELSLDYGPPASYFNNLEQDADYVNYRVFARTITTILFLGSRSTSLERSVPELCWWRNAVIRRWRSPTSSIC